MFKLFVPAEIGGLELSPVEGNRLIYELATHDASSAWVSMIGSTAALGAAFIAPDISADMFAAPSRITCGIFAPNGRAVQDGGTYRVGALGVGVGLGQCRLYWPGVPGSGCFRHAGA